jgi:hypothetical protein
MIVARVLQCAVLAVALVAQYHPACASNPVQDENTNEGTTTWRITNPAMAHEIEGYADRASVARPGIINLFVNTTDPAYTIQVFRIGWYRGKGGRAMTPPVDVQGHVQPACASFSGDCSSCPTACNSPPVTCPVECSWQYPFPVSIADDWPSGVYLAKLSTQGTHQQSYIFFVVRDDSSTSTYALKIGVATYQAYNNWGGHGLYGFNSDAEASGTTVSFDRPYGTYVMTGFPIYPNPAIGAGLFFEWDINAVRWLEREGYDVTYITDIDTHDRPEVLGQHRALLTVGHDEYWSQDMYDAVVAGRNAGLNLGFFGSNELFYRIVYMPSAAGVPDHIIYNSRQLYTDPTATFGVADHAALTGLIAVSGGDIDADIVVTNVSNPDSQWIFAGTELRDGDHLFGLLGYEVDLFDPALVQDRYHENYTQLASSPLVPGSVGNLNAGMSVYQALIDGTVASFATVFATGSMEWVWGLDTYSARRPTVEAGVLAGVFERYGRKPTWMNKRRAPTDQSRRSAAAQQITRNVLARLGLAPAG